MAQYREPNSHGGRYGGTGTKSDSQRRCSGTNVASGDDGGVSARNEHGATEVKGNTNRESSQWMQMAIAASMGDTHGMPSHSKPARQLAPSAGDSGVNSTSVRLDRTSAAVGESTGRAWNASADVPWLGDDVLRNTSME